MARPPRLSIVVLPFANIGGDPEQEYFVNGVTESLTTDLSRVAGSFVIVRNTAFSYKGKSPDVRHVGRELGVRYALEGPQRGGNRMRVNIQLIDAEAGNHLWAERFDNPLADLLDTQDEIVARLANRLEQSWSRPRRVAQNERRIRFRWISVSRACFMRIKERVPNTLHKRAEGTQRHGVIVLTPSDHLEYR